MDQCFPAKKYPKIFLISSKLITTKPPLFSSDMLNHPRLQFLELHKSQKWEERAVRGVTACSPGNKLQLPLLWAARPGRTSHPHSLPSLPPRPAPSLQPHCLCPPLLFSHTVVSPVLVWLAVSLDIPTAQGSQSLSSKAFPACPSSEAQAAHNETRTLLLAHR